MIAYFLLYPATLKSAGYNVYPPFKKLHLSVRPSVRRSVSASFCIENILWQGMLHACSTFTENNADLFQYEERMKLVKKEVMKIAGVRHISDLNHVSFA